MFRKKDKEQAAAENDITAYIKSVTLRKRLFGVSEEDIWAIVSNIQKYYEKKSVQDDAVVEELRKSNEEQAELIAKLKMYIDMAGRQK